LFAQQAESDSGGEVQKILIEGRNACYANREWNWADIEIPLIAKRLEPFPADAVTGGIYDFLCLDSSDHYPIATRLVRAAKGFTPSIWLDRIEVEAVTEHKMTAVCVFDLTSYHTDPRFQVVLQEALLDKRKGLPGRGGSKSHRICDIAYNCLVGHREKPPQGYPIDWSTYEEDADRMIADLCRELGIAPPEPSAPNPAPVVVPVEKAQTSLAVPASASAPSKSRSTPPSRKSEPPQRPRSGSDPLPPPQTKTAHPQCD
jgi:hypothetical protein